MKECGLLIAVNISTEPVKAVLSLPDGRKQKVSLGRNGVFVELRPGVCPLGFPGSVPSNSALGSVPSDSQLRFLGLIRRAYWDNGHLARCVARWLSRVEV